MSKWYTLHIKNEILFWFLILAILPIISLSIINNMVLQYEFYSLSKSNLTKTLEDKITSVEQYSKDMKNTLEISANMPLTQHALDKFSNKKTDLEFSDEDIDKFYKTFSSKVGFYDLFLINMNGNVVYSVKKESDYNTNLISGVYKDTNLASVYTDAKTTLNTQISQFEFYDPSKKMASFVATPIYHNGELTGIIAAQINTDVFDDIFEEIDFGIKSGEIVVSAKNSFGQIVSVNKLKFLDKSDKYVFDKNSSIPAVLAANGQKGSGASVDYRGEEIIASWGYAPTMRWGIVAKVDKKEIMGGIYKLHYYTALIILLVSLGIVFAIFMVINKIIKPIDQLTKNVKNITMGKLETSEPLDVENEIGELARNFYVMAQSLKDSQETINKYNFELEKKVAERTKALNFAKQELSLSNEQLSRYIEIIDKNVDTSSTDKIGVITHVSEAFCEMCGYSKEELVGRTHSILKHPEIQSEVYANMWKVISSGNIYKSELQNVKKDGSTYWVNITIEPIFEYGEIVGYTAIRENITDKKLIEVISITDKLTGLYNRHYLDRALQNEFDRAKRYNQVFSILIIDIDFFKHINDSFGHIVGDSVLKQFSMLLRNSIRTTDILGRWGGEEFLIIATETNCDTAYFLAEKIRTLVQAFNFDAAGSRSCSIGIASYKTGDGLTEILKNADEALYFSKSNGRNQTTKFQYTKEHTYWI